MDKNILAKLINKKKAPKKGVYAEIDEELFDRLQERRQLNKASGYSLDSNYKLIEAAIEMLLDYLDVEDGARTTYRVKK